MAGNNVMAWHYTTGEKFKSIAACGMLIPTACGVRPPERPVLWFSLNQQFEPTARKATIEGGSLRVLSVDETYRRGGGLVRFGLTPHRLYMGEKLRTRAHIGRALWASLCSAAVAQNGDPSLWAGSIQTIPIESLAIDVMNDGGQWECVQAGGA